MSDQTPTTFEPCEARVCDCGAADLASARYGHSHLSWCVVVQLRATLTARCEEDDIPRRAYVNKWTPTEHAIDAALQAVEALAADERLTDAVVLLKAAQRSVADYVDGVPSRRTATEILPVDLSPTSARWQELFWALPPGEMRSQLRALEIDTGQDRRTLTARCEALQGEQARLKQFIRDLTKGCTCGSGREVSARYGHPHLAWCDMQTTRPDMDRLQQQAIDISVALSDAGVSSMPIAEGVRSLVVRCEALTAERDTLRQKLSDADEIRVSFAAGYTAALDDALKGTR